MRHDIAIHRGEIDDIGIGRPADFERAAAAGATDHAIGHVRNMPLDDIGRDRAITLQLAGGIVIGETGQVGVEIGFEIGEERACFSVNL